MIENTASVALSHQMALRRQIDVIANNIANSDTGAFKAERLLLEEFPVRSGGGASLSFVQDGAVVLDFREGEITPTGNPLDLAIQGNGYFAIQTERGERYSRAGQFRINAEGRIVTRDGQALMDENGRSIEVGTSPRTLTIARDGTISVDQEPRGRVRLVRFANELALRPIGNGLYETDQAGEPARNATLMQGALERSNVQPIVEMTRMIEVMRSYQSTQQILDNDHELRRRSIRELGHAA